MSLKRTPLYEVHRALGAKFTDFAGWEMPVEYTGVIDEHLSVRNSCGLFDVSHMGEIEVSGPRALEAVNYFATNDIQKIGDGQCQYTLLCYPHGGVVDDCVVYRFSAERLLFCVNASNTGKVYEWLSGKGFPGVDVKNKTSEYAQLALQGPASPEVLRGAGVDPAVIKHFRFREALLAGGPAIISRTGYTGEDGFEIYTAPGNALRAWGLIMDAGKGSGIKPAGLGARDTLRLEMGYPLYGHELTEDTTPVEAGLMKFVGLDKKDFIGRDAILKRAGEGVKETLAGFEMTGAGVPRAGYEVAHKGEKAGGVTSGTFSPSLRRGIGMAYIRSSLNAPCTGIDVIIRGRPVKAHVRDIPFYVKAQIAV